MEAVLLLLLAFLLDSLVGDPSWCPHPIRGIGKSIAMGEQWLRRIPASSRVEVCRGAVLVGAVVVGTYIGTAMFLSLCTTLSWWMGYGLEIMLGSLCLARRSLKEHAEAIYQPLAASDVATARTMLARIVSRETTDLSEAEIVRGAVESVAENSSDGVMAPLMYLALGGVPLAMTYKAINTLDSMIGYRTERYEYFGKVAARLDDAVNFLPARLTAVVLVVAAWILSRWGYAYHSAAAWQMLWRDGHKHASPNAGYPEAAMAGALGVQLGGSSRYFGNVVTKPTLGDPHRPLTPEHIPQSLLLLDCASGIVLLGGVGLVLLCG
ncbi:MAG: adenosylcobinamide-phosphate synthase CbiB [Candidatus Binatia bacterium]